MQSINNNFQVSYKITKDGRIRAKVFTRSNSNPISNQIVTTQGTGISWERTFDSWGELFESKKKKEKENKEEAPNQDARNEENTTNTEN